MQGFTNSDLVLAACLYPVPDANSSTIGGHRGFPPCKGSGGIIPPVGGPGAMCLDEGLRGSASRAKF